MTEVKINGIPFEVTTKIKFRDWGDTFEDLYKKPSKTKREKYNYWKEKLFTINDVTGNHHLFSIFGTIRDEKTGIIHKVKITRGKNYLLA